MEYSEEALSKGLIAEITPLLEAQWSEIAHYKDVEVDVNWPTYKILFGAKLLKIYTVRDQQKLIGYAVYTLNPNLHYKRILQAQQDVLYIDPEKRKGSTGIKLIRYADRQLKNLGVHSVYHHVKLSKDFGRVLERLGYTFVEKIYTKRL